MSRIQGALNEAVRDAERLGGRVEAAVWIEGWPKPIVQGSLAPMRMWSMAKPITAIALLRLTDGSDSLAAPVADAMKRAIERSENCAQRRVVLELQQRAGGVANARDAVQLVLRDAGAHWQIATETAAAEQFCSPYLQRAGSGVSNPLGPALLLGTSIWTVKDAVSFMHALGEGRLGTAGDQVLRLMREPKHPSGEVPAADYTAKADWGAGRALAGWSPAYKAGWGGALRGNFLAGQIAIFDFHGHAVALAAMFHPASQPDRDDPGRTAAPAAVELIFGAIARELKSSSAAH